MAKDYKSRNQQHKHRKPYNKNNRNQKNQRGGGHAPKGEVGRFQQRKFEPKISLKEDQVGITEFTTSGKGFTGVVKARFSDFHVNEIEPSGKVLQLTDLSIPQPADDRLNAVELETAKNELKDVFTIELWARIETLAQLKPDDTNAETIEVEVTNMDKEKRTQVHKVLKKLYEGKLVSTTVNGNANAGEEKKFIKIMKPKKGRGENRFQWTFPGDYVHFLVHKENMDTSEVAAAMADRLNLRPSQVNYCGTKDKRAKTTQKFCIKRRTPSQIVGSVKGINNVRIGNFEFSQEVLKLGNLKGNRFRIALRHVDGNDAEIEALLQEIQERGFINYYGLQRFGNCASIPTYEIGIALLKCDYKLACELILKPRENDIFFMRAIREAWWKNRNSTEAAAMFYDDRFIEKKILDGLAQYGEHDYAAALHKIPRNMLLLYPHAFQSLIFNQIASRRIKEFGLKLIPGDLVFRNKDEQDDETTEMSSIEEELVEDSTLSANDKKNGKETDEKESEELAGANYAKEMVFKQKVKPLTEEDIASNQYTVFDVVLPLPGFDVAFPENEVGKWYEELLEERGLTIAMLKHNVKTFAMAGAYRKLLIKPEKLKWEFKAYDTPESTLIESDWELLKKKEVLKTAIEEKFKALLIELYLPPSAYATMFLRELLKQDTSAASQTQLQQTEMKKHDESSTSFVVTLEDKAEAPTSEKRKQTENEHFNNIGNKNDVKKIKVCENVEE